MIAPATFFDPDDLAVHACTLTPRQLDPATADMVPLGDSKCGLCLAYAVIDVA